MTDPSASRTVLADWFREQAATLTTLDPHADLDDLEPLRDIVGDARVVAVGENAHFVEEFSSARQRVLRFLAERCGFTVLAYEFSFDGAPVLDRWLHGEGSDSDLRAVSRSAADWGTAGLMQWLRDHNLASGHPLRFVGVDLPEAGGALRPALEPLADYLREVDAESLPLVDAALRVSDSFLTGTGSGAAAAPAWARLERADQDALTAALTRVRLRMRALEPLYVSRSDQHRFDVARCQLESACHTDYMFQAMHGLASGTGRTADMSAREIYMAETVRWHLEHSAPEARIVLAAHNNHIQKTPVEFGGALTALPMGQHLHRMLGEAYRCVALTHTADHVPEMYPDPSTEVGFVLADAHLRDPEPGSIEAALTDAGLATAVTLTDLRSSPRDEQGEPLLEEIRTQSSAMPTRVPEAFDGVLSVPTVTRERSVRF
jgi:erythromycin esterase